MGAVAADMVAVDNGGTAIIDVVFKGLKLQLWGIKVASQLTYSWALTRF